MTRGTGETAPAWFGFRWSIDRNELSTSILRNSDWFYESLTVEGKVRRTGWKYPRSFYISRWSDARFLDSVAFHRERLTGKIRAMNRRLVLFVGRTPVLVSRFYLVWYFGKYLFKEAIINEVLSEGSCCWFILNLLVSRSTCRERDSDYGFQSTVREFWFPREIISPRRPLYTSCSSQFA